MSETNDDTQIAGTILPRRDEFGDVLEFLKKMAPDRVRPLPSWPPYDIMMINGAMVQEEFGELMAAMATRDFAGIVDGALDLVYVCHQLLIGMGVDARPVWDAIQEANMAKEPHPEGGKAIKPDGWTAPKVGEIIASQTKRLDG